MTARDSGRAERLFVVLCAVFITCLVLGDITGGKTTRTPVGPVSVGMLLFPVTFLLTDVINDFYGRRGAQFVTWVAAGMATLAYLALVLTTAMPIDESSYFLQPEFAKVLGGSAKLFVASIVAFIIGDADGIPKALSKSAHARISLSKLTLPHRLARVLLLEQLYRSLSILRGEPYARE